MSSLPDGDYFIITLAITFNGVNQYAAVEPLASPPIQTQIWTIKVSRDKKTFSVTPKGASTDEAGWGSQGSVRVLPAGGYVWSFQDNGDGIIIQDGGLTVYWFVGQAEPGQRVQIGDDKGQPGHRWVLEKA
ncbi:hypothetical protein BD309DRAFT_984298 [Dichomitus squalens]|uniref:CCL2-like lectin domain-containing protein n=1 Tax=Dichomitus squalens TaxID=114155 RepID=A0A4Q9PCB1_9APHY|nr:hypothetical protein BD309DRAFT_984298 [Dichomitus squalens]TBU52218.1 hypothetical protein BD310DRAFT_970931 [Dichomitus squalens]